MKGCRSFLFSESPCGVCIGENAAIIVCMKLRNCRWGAGLLTMNQLLIRASTSIPQWQLRTVLWLQTYKDATTLLPLRRKSAVHNWCHMAFLYASSGRSSLKTHGRPHCILHSVFGNRNYYWRTSRWRMSHSVDRFCCQRWATKSINNSYVRFVMSVCPPVSAYLKAIRVVSFEFLMRVTESVGCSDVVTEDVTDGRTDGLSLSRNVCCLQRATQNDTPSPQLILHLNVHRSELRPVRV